ncbi:MAG: response regulator [Flavisolibacter sp.]
MIPDTPVYGQTREPYLIFVNDNSDDQQQIGQIYSSLNLQHRARYLQSGEELFDFLERADDDELPSLIILDYNMKRLNGSTLLMMIREERRYSQIPVVIYTNSLSHELEKELLLLGATYCRKKRKGHESLKRLLIEFLSMADISHDTMELLKR